MQTLAERMKQLLNSGQAADVHFLVGGEGAKKELLTAHKSVLAFSAYDFFEAILPIDAANGKTTEGKSSWEGISSVVVTDIEAGTLKAMLNYIYTDEPNELNGDNAITLLVAAKKYNITGLYKACLAFPISKLSNVFLAFDQARRLGEEDIARRCLDYIDQNANNLFRAEEFLQIDHNLLCEILDRDQLRIGAEFTIWKAAHRWAREQCHQNGNECTAANRRAVLGLALYKIRLPLIADWEIATHIVPIGVLTKDELISVLMYRANPGLALPKLYPLQFPTECRAMVSKYVEVRNQKFTGKIMLEIEKLSEFAQEDGNNSRRFSENPLFKAGLLWQIEATSNSAKKCLNFYLHCFNAYADSAWSVNYSATFGIVSRQNGTKDYTHKVTQKYENQFSETQSVKGPQIYFEYLMDPSNGLCCNDSVILFINFTVDEPCSAVE